MTEPKKTPRRTKRKRKNSVEENLKAAQAVAGVILTAYNIIAPIVRKMKKKRAAKRRAPHKPTE